MPGTINLTGPSITPNAPRVGVAAIDAAINNAQFLIQSDLTAAFTSAVQRGAVVLSWPTGGAAIAAGTYRVLLAWPWLSGAITSIIAKAGSNSFTFALQVGGVAVSGLSAVTVSSPTSVTTPAGTNAIPTGAAIDVVVSATMGAPTDAAVQINYTRSMT